MHSNARSRTRAALAAGVAAVAAAGLTGCTWFGANTGSTQRPAAATTAKPGVPSGPAYYDRPEPSAVATDPRPGTTTAPGTGTSTGTTTGTATRTALPAVPVLITYSGYVADEKAVQVGGNVTGVIESDGTCTLALTRSGRTVSASAPAEPDATTTDCTGLSVSGADLTPGAWQAVLTYRSAAHTGTSAPVQVVVP